MDRQDVLLTERDSGKGRFVWVVDNVEPDMDPGLAWRTGLILSQRVPLVAVPVGLRVGPDEAVYDVFGLEQVRPMDGRVDADLRSLPARLFAILPQAIDAVEISAPRSVDAGRAFPWTATILDSRSRPVDASLRCGSSCWPVSRTVLREQTVAAREARRGQVGPLGDAPRPPSRRLSLRAVELVSGKTATVSVTAIAPAGPRSFVDMPPGPRALGHGASGAWSAATPA